MNQILSHSGAGRARKDSTMNRYWTRRLQVLALIMLIPAFMLSAGCEQDEGPTGPGEDGAAVALKYVGYSDTTNRNPSCVKCHEEKTFGWRLTAHADALSTIQEISYAQPYCRPCHTTGWDTADALHGADDAWTAASTDTLIYRDVQCEACHGPGSQHNNPYLDSPTDVLMPVDEELWDADLCGRCHEGTHHPYLEEWETSAHATADLAAGGLVATNESCAECHIAQSFERWVTTGESGYIAVDPQPVTCQACHTAHSNDNPGQLRLPLGQNVICGKCHNAEGALPGEAVHHATWEVFNGTLAFTYPGEEYENSIHTTALAVEACVACHVFSSPYVSESEPAKTGHTFKPRIEACQQCHEGATDFDIDGVQTEIQGLIDQLQVEIDAAGTAQKTTTSYLNAKYVLEAMISEGSRGVHNTEYSRKLLQDALADFTPIPSSTGGSR